MIFVLHTNDLLEEKDRQLDASTLEDTRVEANVPKEETVHQLVDKWGFITLARAGMAAVGLLCGIVALQP